MTCPFVEVTGCQVLTVSVSDESEFGMFGIDNVTISAEEKEVEEKVATAAGDYEIFATHKTYPQAAAACVALGRALAVRTDDNIATLRSLNGENKETWVNANGPAGNGVLITTLRADGDQGSAYSDETFPYICQKHGDPDHDADPDDADAKHEATAAGDYDHGASGDVYHQAFDADADGTGAACSEWGGHEFSCGALGGICTNDHDDHHDHEDEEHSYWTRGALSKAFTVPAGSYNVTLDFIQIDDLWDANVARVKVNGVVCWTQDFQVTDYGEGVTPGGLEQCKLDYEAQFGQLHCPQGNCGWYVARLIERESL